MNRHRHPFEDPDHLDGDLDRLLEEAAQCLEIPPAGLLVRTEVRIKDFERRRRRVRLGILAVVSVLFLAGGIWMATRHLGSGEPIREEVAETSQGFSAPTTGRPQVQVKFPAAESVIALPVESKNPKVSILLIYPTVKSKSDRKL